MENENNQNDFAEKNININSSEKINESKELSTISEIMSSAFTVFKKIVWRYIGLSFLPLLFALPLIGIVIAYSFFQLSTNGGGVVGVMFIVLGVINLIALMVVGIIVQASFFVLAASFSTSISVWELFKKSRKIAWKFFVVNLVTGVFVLLWSFLFIIPGIIAMVYYSFASWTLLIEGYESTAAIKRSKEIVKGRWWSLLGRLSLPYLAFLLFAAGPTILIKDSGFQVIWGIVSNVVSYFFAIFFLSYIFILYKDFVRTKGPSKI